MFKRIFIASTLILAGLSHFTPAQAALVVTARHSAPVKLKAPFDDSDGGFLTLATRVFAMCAPGEKVTGGGHSVGFVKGVSVIYSGPTYDINEGWIILF